MPCSGSERAPELSTSVLQFRAMREIPGSSEWSRAYQGADPPPNDAGQPILSNGTVDIRALCADLDERYNAPLRRDDRPPEDQWW